MTINTYLKYKGTGNKDKKFFQIKLYDKKKTQLFDLVVKGQGDIILIHNTLSCPMKALGLKTKIIK